MEKAIVKIKGKDYRLKFTIGFWKKIQELYGIKKSELDVAINENFGDTVTKVVYWGIYYGLDKRPSSQEDMPFKIEDLDDLSPAVLDAIEEAVIDGMTKAEKEMVDKVKKFQGEKIDDLIKEQQSSKKK